MIIGGIFQEWKVSKEHNKRESTTRRIAQKLSIDSERAQWVLDPRGLIRKANLTFIVKFFWLLVLYHLSPTAADKILA